jgi:4-amino-4-deoxy-L-arabinose transferase-like glycosyltransferase
VWSTSFPKLLAVILLGALAIRLAAAFALQDRLDNHYKRPFLISGDANGYWALGEKIAAGKPYSIYDPPRQVLRMPGFPAVLAASMRMADAVGLSQRYLVARLVLALVGTAACALVYRLGADLFDRRIGLIAAALAAFMPSLAAFSVILLSETLFATCMIASLIVLARLAQLDFGPARRGRGVVLSLAAGAAIAAACYVRPTWLLVGPMFVCWYVVRAQAKAEAVVRGALLLAALLACLAPWAARNYRATGHWVLTTLWVGPSLYDGLNAEATGDSNMEFFERDRKRDPRIGQMSEYELDRYYRGKALQFVVENPRRAMELAAIKLWRFWKPWPNAEQFGGAAYRALVGLGFVPALAFAIAGWWVHRRRFWRWALTIGPMLYFAAVHAVFVGSLRYRLPAEYPMYVLTAAGIAAVWAGSLRKDSPEGSGRTSRAST